MTNQFKEPARLATITFRDILNTVDTQPKPIEKKKKGLLAPVNSMMSMNLTKQENDNPAKRALDYTRQIRDIFRNT
jgi:hypothetical protein|tara:strand:+ start:58 stop:285 length:228 start_codon:yes stop_codon:yes gene_type:complete